jgi:hypothetical protein
MSVYEEAYDDVDDDFARPFLGLHVAGLDPIDEAAPHEEVHTRAYLLTGGRTGGGRANVKIETMVVRDPSVPATAPPQAEQAAILEAAGTALAVAEIAAQVHLPLGVVQVLVGDVVADGLLLTSLPAPVSMHDDIDFIERLIHGVSAL